MRRKTAIDYEVDTLMDKFFEWEDAGEDFNEPETMAKFLYYILLEGTQ